MEDAGFWFKFNRESKLILIEKACNADASLRPPGSVLFYLAHTLSRFQYDSSQK